MQEKLNKLESQQREAQAKISRIAFEQWLSSNTTKALKLQLLIDYEDIQDNWVHSRYIGDEEPKARGQAEYIEGLLVILNELRGNNDD